MRKCVTVIISRERKVQSRGPNNFIASLLWENFPLVKEYNNQEIISWKIHCLFKSDNKLIFSDSGWTTHFLFQFNLTTQLKIYNRNFRILCKIKNNKKSRKIHNRMHMIEMITENTIFSDIEWWENCEKDFFLLFTDQKFDVAETLKIESNAEKWKFPLNVANNDVKVKILSLREDWCIRWLVDSMHW